jgi:uncharacterized iron-regulated protein
MRVKMFPAFLILLASLMAQSTPALPAAAPSLTDSLFQTEAHYRIYDATGKAASMEDVLRALDKIEVVCLGELHDDAAGHAFEAELLKRAFAYYSRSDAARDVKRRTLALSLEMFERDVQVIVDEYLRGLINERQFLLSSRPWNNYQKDYRPLVEFAREHNLTVIAANAPARYVNRVSRLGPNSLKELTTAARMWLPPLPYEAASPAYAAKFNQLMTGTQMTGGTQSTQSPHGASYLLDAQSLRDATMAHAIAQQLKRQPDALVLHVNGKFHSEENLGVPEQLRHYRSKTRALVITIVNDKSYPDFDAAILGKLGDFIILTDPQLPRSF